MKHFDRVDRSFSRAGHGAIRSCHAEDLATIRASHTQTRIRGPDA
jgi:hypothetical protein